MVNWTTKNKLRWNLNRNSYIFLQEKASENVVWKMAAILSGVNMLSFVASLPIGSLVTNCNVPVMKPLSPLLGKRHFDGLVKNCIGVTTGLHYGISLKISFAKGWSLCSLHHTKMSSHTRRGHRASNSHMVVCVTGLKHKLLIKSKTNAHFACSTALLCN